VAARASLQQPFPSTYITAGNYCQDVKVVKGATYKLSYYYGECSELAQKAFKQCPMTCNGVWSSMCIRQDPSWQLAQAKLLDRWLCAARWPHVSYMQCCQCCPTDSVVRLTPLCNTRLTVLSSCLGSRAVSFACADYHKGAIRDLLFSLTCHTQLLLCFCGITMSIFTVTHRIFAAT